MKTKTGTMQERDFEELLRSLRIKFTDGKVAGFERIDYYLPEFKLLVELKTYESDRLFSQLESASGQNILVLVGPHSVSALENLLFSMVERNNCRENT